VAQEHLATHHVRNALLTYQHRHPADRGAPRMLAATPSGQRHEFGLLIGALLAQLRGYDVVYLGVDLPSEELLWAAQKSQAEVLLLAASLPISGSGVEQLSELAHRLPERCQVWLGLTSDDPFEAPRVRLFRDFESFELALLESH
jgi:methanogenic corrinoid protein MtbC1